MTKASTFLVFGATGGTGQHFVPLALKEGHRVRALVRDSAKIVIHDQNLKVHQGSFTELTDIDRSVEGVDFVVAMVGDVALQRTTKIARPVVERLIPAMSRHGVKRFLYEAGGLSRPHRGRLKPIIWLIRNTVARGFIGQHEDNEAVMPYLAKAAGDLEWIVHRAGIGSNETSKGVLERSNTKLSVATFGDCAAYNYRTVMDEAAIRTCDFSVYRR